MGYHLLMNALRPFLAVILMLLAPMGISIANAQEALPFEIELPLSGVKVELNDCLLEVTIEPGVEAPLVRARELEGAVGEPATFSVGMGVGQVKITQTPPAEGTDPARAIVELVLDPRQPLHVIGRDIMLVVRAPRGGTDGADSAPRLPGEESAQGAAVSHTYELLDSEADLTGIPSANIVADNTAVHSDGGSGALAAQLTWSGLTVANHTGGIRIASADSETTLDGFTGPVEFEIQGGGLRLREGSGTVQGRCDNGFIASFRWSGSFALGGDGASFEVRDGSVGQLKITSTDAVTTIEDIRGNVNIEATGGQITMDSVQGNLTATISDGGRGVMDSVSGALVLNLRDNAYGEVNHATGSVKARVDSAELNVSAAKSLDLISTDSRAALSGIQDLAGFEAHESEVDLDLREVKDRKLTLLVAEGTSVNLSLKAPCKVQVRESPSGGSGINVVGCELQMERAGKWKRGRIDADGGQRPFMLIAKVAETGSLRVQGGF